MNGQARNGQADAPAVAARGLTKRFGSTLAVNELSFAVGWGKITGFLGPNGAGKTTTLRMLLGLARPTAGRATIAGLPYRKLKDPGSIVGAALDHDAAHPRRTGRNHLRVLAAAAGVPDERVDQLLETVDLSGAARKRVGEYSTGMRQRLSLAAALLGEPRILLLDEPANGLDPRGMHWLRDFLRDFAAQGNAVFVSSHLLAEMSLLADEVVVIDHGQLVVQAPIHALVAGSTARVVVRTPDPATLEAALREAGLEPAEAADGALAVEGGSVEQVGAIAARAGVVVHGLQMEERSLEEVFLALTGPKEGER